MTESAHTSSASNRRVGDTTRHLVPWAIFAGALALRLAYLWQAAHADPLFADVRLVDDSRFYDMSARAVATGHLWPDSPYFLAPLYFYVMGALYAVSGPHILGVQILQCLLGAASCVLVQRIGRRVFSETVGNVAGVLLAVYGLHVYYSGVILPTILVTFLNLLFLWLVIDVGERPGRLRLLVAGLVSGLAVAAKPNAILMLPAVALALFFVEREHGLRAWGLRCAVLTAGTVVAIAPFIVHDYATSGEFVFVTTTSGRNLLKGNGPSADGSHVFFPDDSKRTRLESYLIGHVPGRVAVAEDRRMRAAARRFMLDHPARTAALLLKKFVLFFNATELSIRDQYYFAWRYSPILGLPLLGFGTAIPIALVALPLAWRRRPRSLVLIAAIAAQVASLVPLFILARYRMVAVVCLLPFSAYGLVAVTDVVRDRRWRLLAGLAAAWALASLFVYLPFAEFPRDRGFADQWKSLGDHYLGAGEDAAAIAAYEAALGGDWLHPNEGPRNTEVRVLIARARLAEGDLAGARLAMERVRSELPADRKSWPGRVERAFRVLEREIEARSVGAVDAPRDATTPHSPLPGGGAE